MNENTTIHQRLCEIQKKLKVGKEHNNSFGKYKYRKAEDILKEIKEYLIDDEYITTSAQIQLIQERFYVVITACFHKSLETVCATGYARESFDKKGMDDAQLTGATTSYAKKYALCNLFAIDDEADNDDEDVQKKAKVIEQGSTAQKEPIKTKEQAKPVAENPQRKITDNERDELIKLISDAEKDIAKICSHYKVAAISELLYIQYASAKAICEKAINDMN